MVTSLCNLAYSGHSSNNPGMPFRNPGGILVDDIKYININY